MHFVGADRAGGTNVAVHDREGSSTDVAIYETTGDPAFGTAALHETSACPSPVVATTLVGFSGI